MSDKINPELIYTRELARTIARVIADAETAQKHFQDCAFDRAIQRGRDAVTSMMATACDELGVAGGAEMRDFIRSLEDKSLPARPSKRSRAANELSAGEAPVDNKPVSSVPIRASRRSTRSHDVELVPTGHGFTIPSDATSKSIMDQWR